MDMPRNTTAFDPVYDTQYHYIPTKYVCTIFVVLFGLSTLLHLAQATVYRLWYMIPTAGFGGALETLGWSARLWSSNDATLRGPFLIQITSCIIGPTPLLAANFVIFGGIIERLGSQYSRLRPKWYTIIFCSCDVVALAIQGTGGGLASTAETNQAADTGGNIVLGGIVFQLAVILTFVACQIEFLLRWKSDRPVKGRESAMSFKPELNSKVKTMLYALAFNTLCLVIRAIFRTIELVDGWDGRIISTQLYFNVLDGAMITLAIFTLNLFHPGYLLGRPYAGAANPSMGTFVGSTGMKEKSVPNTPPNQMA